MSKYDTFYVILYYRVSNDNPSPGINMRLFDVRRVRRMDRGASRALAGKSIAARYSRTEQRFHDVAVCKYGAKGSDQGMRVAPHPLRAVRPSHHQSDITKRRARRQGRSATHVCRRKITQHIANYGGATSASRSDIRTLRDEDKGAVGATVIHVASRRDELSEDGHHVLHNYRRRDRQGCVGRCASGVQSDCRAPRVEPGQRYIGGDAHVRATISSGVATAGDRGATLASDFVNFV